MSTQTSSAGIAGKVVAITGASSGLGEETALHLARAGARLVLGARRTDRLTALVDRIRADGGTAVFRQTDVTDATQVEALIACGIETYGRLDVLINNAGLMALAPLNQGRIAEWDRMIDINVKGMLYGIAAALPRMQAQGSGQIINLASVAGHKLFTPIGTVYSATKFAVRALSEGLREEAGPYVRVTVISPGAVQSELKLGSSDRQTAEAVAAFYAANEIPATAVAEAIAYAIAQPADVDINEIVLRATVQVF